MKRIAIISIIATKANKGGQTALIDKLTCTKHAIYPLSEGP